MSQENQSNAHQSHVPQQKSELNVAEISGKIREQFLEVYNSGVNLFSIAKYTEAKQKFLDCMIYGYESDKCLKSVASCCQMLEEYDDAINFYRVAILYNEESNIDCYQFIGVCAVKAKKFEEGLASLDYYLERVGEDGDIPDRIKSAKLYSSIARKKIAEASQPAEQE